LKQQAKIQYALKQQAKIQYALKQQAKIQYALLCLLEMIVIRMRM